MTAGCLLNQTVPDYVMLEAGKKDHELHFTSQLFSLVTHQVSLSSALESQL